MFNPTEVVIDAFEERLRNAYLSTYTNLEPSYPGIISYVASKWAVRGMTKTAARELAASGIRDNSIHPGFIHTHLAVEEEEHLAPTHALLDAHSARLAPMGRSGEPEEIARLALFLASDESSYSTGSEFVADGGLVTGYPPPGSDV